jgi:hypothetical protein
VSFEIGTKEFYIEQKRLLRKYGLSNRQMEPVFSVIKRFPGINFQEKPIYGLSTIINPWSCREENNLILHYFDQVIQEDLSSKSYYDTFDHFVEGMRNTYFLSIRQNDIAKRISVRDLKGIFHLIRDGYFLNTVDYSRDEEITKPTILDIMNVYCLNENQEVFIVSLKLKDEELDRKIFGEASYYARQ